MNEPPELPSQAKTHAQLSVMLATLKSFKLIEWITLLISLLAIFGAAYTQYWPLKLLGFSAILLGLIVSYFALRIRIDIALFERWDSLEITALDKAILSLNPKHKTGRTLDARLQGSYQLFKRGLYLMLMQFTFAMILLWLIKP